MGLHVFPIPIPPPTSLSTRTFIIIFKKNFHLFIFDSQWLFVATCGLSLVVVSTGYCSLWCAELCAAGGEGDDRG